MGLRNPTSHYVSLVLIESVDDLELSLSEKKEKKKKGSTVAENFPINVRWF